MARVHVFLLLLSLVCCIQASLSEPNVVGSKPNRPKLEANWSFFEVVSPGDPRQGRDFVLSLPVSTFWDSIKGSFRTGILGEDITELHAELPHLVTKVEKSVQHAGERLQVEQAVVDHVYVFTNMLLAVQYLIGVAEELQKTVQGFDRSANITAVLEDIYSTVRTETCAESDSEEICRSLFNEKGEFVVTPHAELAMQREILAIHEATFNLTSELARHEHELQMELIGLRNTERRVQRDAMHASLLEAMETQRESIIAAQEEHTLRLEALMNTTESNEYAIKKAELEAEYAEQVQALKDEIKISLELIAFRHAEEIKVIAEAEERERNILSLKHDYMRQSTEEVVSVVCDEIVKLFLFLFQDVYFVLQWSRWVFLAIVFFVTLIEVASSLQLIYYKLYVQRNQLYSQAKRSPVFLASLPFVGRFFSSSLPLPQALAQFDAEMHKQRMVFNKNGLKHLRGTFTHTALSLSERTPLPNVLLCGAPGCGKSETAKLLMSALSPTPFLRLSGADILSLGARANTYLKEIFERYESAGVPTMIFIDEADHLITTRDKNAVSPTRTAVNSQKTVTSGGMVFGSPCLFAFLEALRSPSKVVSLVLCTRLSVKQIDPALLDRMDRLLYFPLPSWRERLLFVAEHVKEQIVEFIADKREKAIVEKLNNVFDSHEEMMQELLRALSLHDLHALLSNPLSPQEEIEQAIHRHVQALFGMTGSTSTLSVNEATSKTSDPELELPQSPSPVISSSSAASAHDHTVTMERLQEMLRLAVIDFINTNGSTLFSTDHYDVLLCVKAMVLCSHNWSFRDLQKRLTNLRYSVLCSESCLLNTQVWMKELTFEEMK